VGAVGELDVLGGAEFVGVPAVPDEPVPDGPTDGVAAGWTKIEICVPGGSGVP
jgi:hypothetical protein